MIKIRNRSRDAIQGQVRRNGKVENVQFQPGVSTFAAGTVLLTSHPKLKVAGETAAPAAQPSPPKPKTAPKRARRTAAAKDGAGEGAGAGADNG